MNTIFDKHRDKYDKWYDENRYAFLSELEALKKVVPKFGLGLEIGVGTGRFAELLHTDFGIDSSVEMLSIALRRGINTRLGFGENIPFWKETFDYITIIVSLCFVKEPEQVLKEAYRVLKEGGKIIVGIVDKESFLGKLYMGKKSVFYKKARFFDVEEITTLITCLGFRRIRYFQTIFNIPSKIESVQRPKKGFGIGGFVVISAVK